MRLTEGYLRARNTRLERPDVTTGIVTRFDQSPTILTSSLENDGSVHTPATPATPATRSQWPAVHFPVPMVHSPNIRSGSSP